MPYNLLLLPLLGGYYIISNFKYLEYKYRRLPPQRLILASLFSGVLLGIALFLGRVFLYYFFPDKVIKVLNNIHEELPIERIDFIWTAFGCFFIAIAGTVGLNWFLKKNNYFGFKHPAEWAVREYGNELEQLFMQSAIDGNPLQVSLKNSKVYIGFTQEIPKPGVTNYLKITPVLSGYRNSDTKEFLTTTRYKSALRGIEERTHIKPNFNCDIIIKQDEIITATPFNWELQEFLESAAKQAKSVAVPTDGIKPSPSNNNPIL